MGAIELGGFFLPPPPGSFPPSNPGVLCFPPGGNDARNIKDPLPGGETKQLRYSCVSYVGPIRYEGGGILHTCRSATRPSGIKSQAWESLLPAACSRRSVQCLRCHVCMLPTRPQRHFLLAEWKRHYNRFTELGESLAVNSSGLAGLDDVWMVRRKTGRTEGCVFGGDECVPEVSDLAYCCS